MYKNLVFNSKTQFGWVGFAYIKKMVQQSDGFLCSMNVVHSSYSGNKPADEIYLNCSIKNVALLPLCARFETELSRGNSILMQFVAEDICFESLQFDQDPDYQNHLIHFRARLVDVNEYFVSDHRLFK